MAITELCATVGIDVLYTDEVTASKNKGQIIIDIDEDNFTDTMKRALAGISFSIYTKTSNDGQLILIANHSYVWSSKNDLSMMIVEVPSSFYFGIQPIIDGSRDLIEYTSAAEETYDSDAKYYIRTGKGTIPSPYIYVLKTDVTATNFDELKNDLYVGTDITEFPITISFNDD